MININNSEKVIVKKYINLFEKQYTSIKLDRSYFDRKGYTYYHFKNHVKGQLQGQIIKEGDSLIEKVKVYHGNTIQHGFPYTNTTYGILITVMLSYIATIISIALSNKVETDIVLYLAAGSAVVALILLTLLHLFYQNRYDRKRCSYAYSHLMLEIAEELKPKKNKCV